MEYGGSHGLFADLRWCWCGIIADLDHLAWFRPGRQRETREGLFYCHTKRRDGSGRTCTARRPFQVRPRLLARTLPLAPR